MPAFIAVLIMAFIVFFGLFLKSLRNSKKIQIAERISIDKEKIDIDKSLSEAEIVPKSWIQKKQTELVQSNTGINLVTYLSILALSVITVFVFVLSVLQNAAAALAFSAFAFFIPEHIVKSLIKKNVLFFNSQLLKALRRMASNLRSGGSVKQAIVDVTRARSIPVIVRLEFRKVLSDIEYGIPVEQAFFRLAERTGSKDVFSLAVAIEIQRQLGGNIAQIMDSVAQGISNRAIMESDIKATLAQAKASSKLLTLLPAGAIMLMLIFNRDFFRPMFDNMTGRVVFLICLTLIIIGFFIFQKMSTIDDL